MIQMTFLKKIIQLRFLEKRSARAIILRDVPLNARVKRLCSNKKDYQKKHTIPA